MARNAPHTARFTFDSIDLDDSNEIDLSMDTDEGFPAALRHRDRHVHSKISQGRTKPRREWTPQTARH